MLDAVVEAVALVAEPVVVGPAEVLGRQGRVRAVDVEGAEAVRAVAHDDVVVLRRLEDAADAARDVLDVDARVVVRVARALGPRLGLRRAVRRGAPERRRGGLGRLGRRVLRERLGRPLLPGVVDLEIVLGLAPAHVAVHGAQLLEHGAHGVLGRAELGLGLGELALGPDLLAARAARRVVVVRVRLDEETWGRGFGTILFGTVGRRHARAARALWISAEMRRSYSAHLLLGGAARPCLRLGLLWRFASSSAS